MLHLYSTHVPYYFDEARAPSVHSQRVRRGQMLGDNHALLAQPWDPDWRCVALDDLGTPVRVEVDAECGALLHASKAHFPVLPSGATNREE